MQPVRNQQNSLEKCFLYRKFTVFGQVFCTFSGCFANFCQLFFFFLLFFFARIAFKGNPWKDEKKQENSSLLSCRRKICIALCGLLIPVHWLGKLSIIFYCNSYFWKFLGFSILGHPWHEAGTVFRMKTRLRILFCYCLRKFSYHSGNGCFAPVN